MGYTEADYLDLTRANALRQWHGILSRSIPTTGNQVDYVPVETLLCVASMYVVEHSRYGSSSAGRAPEPVQALARLFKRKPTSIIAKMNNLDGARSRGARHDLLVGTILRTDLAAMTDIYRMILNAARSAGIDRFALPDFLGIEDAGDIELFGQDELDSDAIGSVIEREIAKWLFDGADVNATERTMLASLRVGQHRFARGVLESWAHECAFCGFSMNDRSGPTLLRASHIKPWRESNARERLDVRNGFAACATHDAAFDVGLLTVSDQLEVKVSTRLDQAIHANQAARTYFSAPHLRDRIILPKGTASPATVYLSWHRAHIFEGRLGSDNGW